MTTNYDPRAYAKLLVEYLPGVITTEEENDRALEITRRLQVYASLPSALGYVYDIL